MIMVDELAFPDHRGRMFCHMTSDNPQELHQFAAKIGLKRCWFHNSVAAPHYDLTAFFRNKALAAGAVFVRAVDQAKKRIAARKDRTKVMTKPIEEGDKCSCGGVFQWPAVAECTCHLHPPCHACVENKLTCSVCGVTSEEEQG